MRFTDCSDGCWSSPASTTIPKRSGEKILEAIQMAWMDEGDFDDD